MKPARKEKQRLAKKQLSKQANIYKSKSDVRSEPNADRVIDPDDSRTIFIGNVAKETSKKNIRKLFAQFGTIDTIRLRGLVPNKANLYKKIALASDRLSENMRTVIFFVRFASPKEARAATVMDSSMLDNRHIRVRLCSAKSHQNLSKSVFVGNLPFDADEEVVRKIFEEQFGEVSDVRIVRDRNTYVGKGFGYVEFKSTAGVDLALRSSDGDVLVGGRDVRIGAVQTGKFIHTNNNDSIKSKCIVTIGKSNDRTKDSESNGRPKNRSAKQMIRKKSRKRQKVKTTKKSNQAVRVTC